jgi:hypothetical protein
MVHCYYYYCYSSRARYYRFPGVQILEKQKNKGLDIIIVKSTQKREQQQITLSNIFATNQLTGFEEQGIKANRLTSGFCNNGESSGQAMRDMPQQIGTKQLSRSM